MTDLRFTAPDEDGPVDKGLMQFATPRQAEVLRALIAENGNQSAAARLLGIGRSTLRNSISGLKRSAASRGYSPKHDMTHVVPEPYVVKGTSTYYDAEGKPRQQWVKSRLDHQQFLEMIREAAASFAEGVGPIEVPEFDQPEFDTDIIPWIQIGDAHIGMTADEAETNGNFNAEIAEREICAAFKLIIEAIPPCERLVLNDLGDFTHFENMRQETEASGHRLDGVRFNLMIRVYSRIMRFLVDLALTRAKAVDVIVNQGNHSRTNDLWMAELLRVAYGASGRVNVLNNENVFTGYRMGATLVMTHHSDKCRPAQMPDVMMADFAKDFAETTFKYADLGHIHHKMVVKEASGVVVESWNTLAPGDKYHHDKGYRSRQSMTVVFRSRTYGEVGRRIVPIEMVRDAIMKGHDEAGLHYVPQKKRAFVA